MTSAARRFPGPGRRFWIGVALTGTLGIVLFFLPNAASADLGLGLMCVAVGLLIVVGGLLWLSSPSRRGPMARLLALPEQLLLILIGLAVIGFGLVSLVSGIRAL